MLTRTLAVESSNTWKKALLAYKPSEESFKNLEGTISASCGLGLLQMVSEPDTGRCASEEAKPRRGVDVRRCASKDVGRQRGVNWGVHIDWRRERVLVRTLGPKGGGL